MNMTMNERIEGDNSHDYDDHLPPREIFVFGQVVWSDAQVATGEGDLGSSPLMPGDHHHENRHQLLSTGTAGDLGETGHPVAPRLLDNNRRKFTFDGMTPQSSIRLDNATLTEVALEGRDVVHEERPVLVVDRTLVESHLVTLPGTLKPGDAVGSTGIDRNMTPEIIVVGSTESKVKKPWYTACAVTGSCSAGDNLTEPYATTASSEEMIDRVDIIRLDDMDVEESGHVEEVRSRPGGLKNGSEPVRSLLDFSLALAPSDELENRSCKVDRILSEEEDDDDKGQKGQQQQQGEPPDEQEQLERAESPYEPPPTGEVPQQVNWERAGENQGEQQQEMGEPQGDQRQEAGKELPQEGERHEQQQQQGESETMDQEMGEEESHLAPVRRYRDNMVYEDEDDDDDDDDGILASPTDPALSSPAGKAPGDMDLMCKFFRLCGS